MGLCLNGASECPQRYRRSTITSYIRRALTHCSSWKETMKEIEFASQTLINNGFSNTEIHKVTRDTINKWYDSDGNTNQNNKIKIYYQNQYHRHYQQDERALRKIIDDNVKVLNEEDQLSLTIYYKNRKTSSLILRNNPSPTTPILKRRNVVYQFICPNAECTASYIGKTTMTLSKRISCHALEGNIFTHFRDSHGSPPPSREDFVKTFEIVDQEANPRKLSILEALHIAKQKPSINVTQEPFLLPSCTTPRQLLTRRPITIHP